LYVCSGIAGKSTCLSDSDPVTIEHIGFRRPCFDILGKLDVAATDERGYDSSTSVLFFRSLGATGYIQTGQLFHGCDITNNLNSTTAEETKGKACLAIVRKMQADPDPLCRAVLPYITHRLVRESSDFQEAGSHSDAVLRLIRPPHTMNSPLFRAALCQHMYSCSCGC
jgi:hypothetical protein